MLGDTSHSNHVLPKVEGDCRIGTEEGYNPFPLKSLIFDAPNDMIWGLHEIVFRTDTRSASTVVNSK